MDLEIKHLIFWSADINKAKDFYVEKLGLEILESAEHFFAVKCGDIRFSFFEGAKIFDNKDDSTGVSIIFKTNDLQSTKAALISKDIILFEDITEAPGFMKHFSVKDPDGNLVFFGEYLKDPLEKP